MANIMLDQFPVNTNPQNTDVIYTKQSAVEMQLPISGLKAFILADAVSANTANTAMKRDASGRAQVSDPSSNLDIVNLETLNAITPAQITNAASAATPSTFMARDASGRAQVSDPSANADIANKEYSDVNSSRNWFMNGQGQVSQRGTSFADGVLPINTKNYLWDRFIQFITNKGSTTIAASQGVLSPGTADELILLNSGLKNYMRLSPGAAGSGFAVTDYCKYSHYIENGVVKLCGGRNVTLTFMARASVAGKKLGVALEQYYGTGGSPSANTIIPGQIITLTSSFVQYSVTFTTLSLSGKTLGTNNDDALIVEFFQQFGTTVATNYFGGGSAEGFGGAGTIDITGISITQSVIAKTYTPIPYAEELEACRRYGIPLYYAMGGPNPAQDYAVVRMAHYNVTALWFPVNVGKMRFLPGALSVSMGIDTTDFQVADTQGNVSSGWSVSTAFGNGGFQVNKSSHGLTDGYLYIITLVPFINADY